MFKVILRSHLEYTDISYDNAENESFKTCLDKIQYNAAPAIAVTIKNQRYIKKAYY